MMLDSELSFQGKDYLRVVVKNPQFVFFSCSIFFSGALFNSTRNSSAVESETRGYLKMTYDILVPWTVAYSVVAAAILFGNGLVIISFAKRKFLRTHTNYFIVSLAATDWFVGVISIPWWIVVLFVSHQRETWYAFLHDIWIIFDILGGVGSILHLVALSWDRFCAIVWPLSHRIYTSRRYLFILAVIWSIAIPVALCSKPGMALAPKAYNVTIIVLCFFVPLFIVCGTQAAVVISIRKTRMQNSYRFKRSLRKEIRVAKTVMIMIALFIIGWLPFFTLSLVTYIKPEIVPSMQAICAVKFLQYGNSAVNPVLYANKFPHFRKAFAAILCPCRQASKTARNVGESFRTTLSSLASGSIRKKNGPSYWTSLQSAIYNRDNSSNVDSNSARDTGATDRHSSEEIELQGSNSNGSSQREPKDIE